MAQENVLLLSIISGLSISITSGLVIFMIKRGFTKKDIEKKLDDEWRKTIELNRKSIWRLNKTVLIMAKIIDNQTEKSHPELTGHLEKIAKELLDESNS